MSAVAMEVDARDAQEARRAEAIERFYNPPLEVEEPSREDGIAKFNLYANEDGTINIDKIPSALRALRKYVKEASLQDTLTALGFPTEGTLTQEQFLEILPYHRSVDCKVETTLKMFRVIDQEDTGKISVDELCDFFEKNHPDYTEELFESYMARANEFVDEEGILHYKPFVEMENGMELRRRQINAEYERTFAQVFAEYGSGDTITIDSVPLALNALGIDFDAEDLTLHLVELQGSAEGIISRETFAELVKGFRRNATDYVVKEFSIFDKDNNGLVDLKYLTTLLSNQGSRMRPEEVEEFIGETSAFIKDGKLDYRAFVEDRNAKVEIAKGIHRVFDQFGGEQQGFLTHERAMEAFTYMGIDLTNRFFNRILEVAPRMDDGSFDRSTFVRIGRSMKEVQA